MPHQITGRQEIGSCVPGALNRYFFQSKGTAGRLDRLTSFEIAGFTALKCPRLVLVQWPWDTTDFSESKPLMPVDPPKAPCQNSSGLV